MFFQNGTEDVQSWSLSRPQGGEFCGGLYSPSPPSMTHDDEEYHHDVYDDDDDDRRCDYDNGNLL